MPKLKSKFDSGKKVSVVVPIYKEKTSILQKCIESLINQADEIFVVYGPKTYEQLIKLADTYAKKGVKKIYSKKDDVSAKRNLGWKVARNEYVFFLDADEYLPKNFMKKLKANLRDPYDMFTVLSIRKATNFISKINEIETCTYKDSSLPRIFKKHVLTSVGGFNENLETCEDFDLHKRAVKAGFKNKDLLNFGYYHVQWQSFKEFISKHTWSGKDNIRILLIDPKNTLVFYAMNFFLMMPIYFLLFPLMILLWLAYEVYNVVRLFYITKSLLSFLMPFFDILRGLFVMIGLVTQTRVF